MPKLYEYLGLIILFYSNEHEPIHVHGKYQGTESKAELIIEDGEIVEIRYGTVKGRKPLSGNALKNFQAVVEYHAEEIIQKWIDYFVLHKSIQSKRITRKIR
ncbi:MAG: DUF4160 domain-containing protein [Ardenticatenaceae bacterium]